MAVATREINLKEKNLREKNLREKNLREKNLRRGKLRGGGKLREENLEDVINLEYIDLLYK